ncbi:hypothetical protein GQ55_5G416100 [Panicum hallii var. hallii]|uniref:Uncharacterized protein n=1 Tax=Panicum hallii var. hallii TaxID=1504633 RepID=A0A2T7DNV7_9POAL|nr:hypothetical protein GQ55_5G416100 [Panicum hallii var. hallii]
MSRPLRGSRRRAGPGRPRRRRRRRTRPMPGRRRAGPCRSLRTSMPVSQHTVHQVNMRCGTPTPQGRACGDEETGQAATYSGGSRGRRRRGRGRWRWCRCMRTPPTRRRCAHARPRRRCSAAGARRESGRAGEVSRSGGGGGGGRRPLARRAAGPAARMPCEV